MFTTVLAGIENGEHNHEGTGSLGLHDAAETTQFHRLIINPNRWKKKSFELCTKESDFEELHLQTSVFHIY